VGPLEGGVGWGPRHVTLLAYPGCSGSSSDRSSHPSPVLCPLTCRHCTDILEIVRSIDGKVPGLAPDNATITNIYEIVFLIQQHLERGPIVPVVPGPWPPDNGGRGGMGFAALDPLILVNSNMKKVLVKLEAVQGSMALREHTHGRLDTILEIVQGALRPTDADWVCTAQVCTPLLHLCQPQRSLAVIPCPVHTNASTLRSPHTCPHLLLILNEWQDLYYLAQLM
jgi:hypothetical protein